MSNPAALVPVPFYAPVRTPTGNTGTAFNFNPMSDRTRSDARQDQFLASEVQTKGVYDQRGWFAGNPWIGRIVNIWV